MPKARTHTAGFRRMMGFGLIIHEQAPRAVGTTPYRKRPRFPMDFHTRAASAMFVRGYLHHCADTVHTFTGQVIPKPDCAVPIRL